MEELVEQLAEALEVLGAGGEVLAGAGEEEAHALGNFWLKVEEVGGGDDAGEVDVELEGEVAGFSERRRRLNEAGAASRCADGVEGHWGTITPGVA